METLQTLTQPLGWAILHSLWQGLLLYVLLKIVLKSIPGRYSAARYYTAISFITIQVIWFFSNIINNLGYHGTALLITPGNATPITNIDPAPVENVTSTGAITQLIILYNNNTGLISGLYTIGISLLIIRLAYNIYNTQSLKKSGISQIDNQWQQAISSCLQKIKINRYVQIYFSTKVDTPITMGSFKPVILIPVAIANQLSIQEAEAILLHELAHIKRNDFLVNLFQMIIETIMFYNPFTWLMSSIIRKEREHCCDDIVVQNTDQKMPYAKALASIESYRQLPEHVAMAATGNKNYLLNRIKRIMEMKKTNINQSQLITVSIVALLTIASVIFLSGNIYAQKKDDKDKKKIEKTVVIKEEKIVIVDDNGKKKVYTSLEDVPKKEREKLEKMFEGSDATILIGPKKKVLVKAYTTDDIDFDRSSNDNHQITIDIDDVSDAAATATNAAKVAISTASEVLKEIDIEEIIDSALQSIDWDEIKQEIKEAQDATKEATTNANKHIVVAKKVHSTNMREANLELEEARRELEEARRELEEARRDLRKKQLSATRELEETRRDLRKKQLSTASSRIHISSSKDELIESLEKDGLINKSKGYKVEKKGSVLYIDGIKQSKEVFKKYEPMMDAKNMTIKGNKRSISINVTD